MLGGYASIFEMIARLKGNRNQITKRIKLFDRPTSLFDQNLPHKNLSSEPLNYLEATPEVLDKIKSEKKLENDRAGKIRFVWVMALSVLISVLVSIFLFKNYFSVEQEQFLSRQEKKELAERKRKLEVYKTEVNFWLAKKHWHNAAFQARKVLEREPKNDYISERLAFASLMLCSQGNEECKMSDWKKSKRFASMQLPVDSLESEFILSELIREK